MDCDGVQKYAGDEIDRTLPKEVKVEFQAHLERCKPCRRGIALEKLSKHLVRQSVRWIQTPRNTQTYVRDSLQRESERTAGKVSTWLSRIFSLSVTFPALAGGIFVIGFYLLVSVRQASSEDQAAHTASNDIIHQTFQNLALLQSGQLQPELVFAAPESVGGFFRRSILQFEVNVPKLPRCVWYGGAVLESGGVKQARLVYRMGKEWIYVCEVRDIDAFSGGQLSMPPAARTALDQWGWYTDPTHPDCNVVLWKTNQTVCVAVSTIKKPRLLAMLTAQ